MNFFIINRFVLHFRYYIIVVGRMEETQVTNEIYVIEVSLMIQSL
jgi:hypothetical protein